MLYFKYTAFTPICQQVFCFLNNCGIFGKANCKGDDNMSENKELLESIYKNAEMGRDSIEYLTEHTDSPKFRDALSRQQMEYQSIMDDARKMLGDHGHSPQGVGMMAKGSAKMMVGAKTMIDPTVGNMAEMMINGSNKGIVKLTSELNGYKHLDSSVHELADRLLKTEENNITQMKTFL